MNINQYVESYASLINIIPNFFSLMDRDYNFILANVSAAKSMGFKSPDHVAGFCYTDMKCEAAKEAEAFKKLDALVFKNKKLVKYISLYQYATGWGLRLGTKSPLFDENSGLLIGLCNHAIDVTHSNLIDISRFIPEINLGSYKIDKKKFIYILEGWENNYFLTDRQLECLFFLVRGKTSKNIARILNLSSRTIEGYINDIKLKMHCSSKNQIIEKSFMEGLVTIVPKSFTNQFKT